MGFNSAFKGLMHFFTVSLPTQATLNVVTDNSTRDLL